MNRNYIFGLALLAVVLCFAPLFAAGSNAYVKDGDVVDITWSSTSPTAGDPVIKGTATSSGAIVGMALNGTATANENVTVLTKGVCKLSVQAIGSAIAIGDYVYTSAPSNINTCTASCTNTNTGYLFGKALEALVVASGSQKIKVLLMNR